MNDVTQSKYPGIMSMMSDNVIKQLRNEMAEDCKDGILSECDLLYKNVKFSLESQHDPALMVFESLERILKVIRGEREVSSESQLLRERLESKGE